MIRFMFMGGMSTLLMLGIYVLLTYIVNFQIAYFIAYLITVIVLYLLNSFYVFKNRLSFKTFFSFSGGVGSSWIFRDLFAIVYPAVFIAFDISHESTRDGQQIVVIFQKMTSLKL
jgi:putative flippase GtrA